MIAKLTPTTPGRPTTYWDEKNRRWMAVQRVYFAGDPDSPRKVTGSSPNPSRGAGRAEAEARLDVNIEKYRRKFTRTVGVRPGDRLEVLYDDWLGRAQGQDYRQGSLENYDDTWVTTVKPLLGRHRIDEVTTPIIAGKLHEAAWKPRRLKGGKTSDKPEFHPGVAKSAYNLLRHLFRHAVALGLIDRSPVVPEAQPVVKVTHMQARKLTYGDVLVVRRLFDAYEEKHATRGAMPLRAMAEVMLHTGARPGEMLALTTADLDIDDTVYSDEDLDHGMTVYIGSTQKRVGGTRDGVTGRRAGTQLIRQELPKGGKRGRRIVTVSGACVRRWIEPHVESLRPRQPQYIFRTSSGAPVERNNLSRSFRQALEGTEYEGWVTPKTFRHSVAQAIVNGLTPETAQRLLGHASLATTLGFYAEQPVDRIDVSEFLDGAFANVDADDADEVL